MKNSSPLGLVIQVILIAALVDLFVIGVIAMIGWWSGWVYLAEFKKAVQIAGLLVIGIGLLGMRRNLFQTRQNERHPALPRDSREGNERNWVEILRKFSFLAVSFFSGLICLLIGWLL